MLPRSGNCDHCGPYQPSPERTGGHLTAHLDCATEGAVGEAPKFAGRMEDQGRALKTADFGTLLRHYRLAAGLSQEALAERARMSTNGISALERGYRRTPQRETLALLAGALALNDEQREEFEAAAARSVLLGRGAPR